MEQANYFTGYNKREGFLWKAEDKREFRTLRAFIFGINTHMAPCFMCRLADKMDDVRELKAGEEMYFIIAKYDCYTASTLEGINKTYAMMRNAVETGELSDNYKPYSDGFCIRRTAKRYEYHKLNTIN